MSLLKRLAPEHEKFTWIEEDFRRRDSGSRGEERLIKKLEELRLDHGFRVLPNVELRMENWTVQIDCLVLTDRCCIVLESKNISGELYFKENVEDFYKVVDGEELSYPNPYFQLMKHLRFMKELLKKDFPSLKVTGAVVITSKNSRIREKPSYYPIFKLEAIVEKLYQMYDSSPAEPLSSRPLGKIENLLLKIRAPYKQPPLCEYYRIQPSELIPGVECPNCGVIGMKREGKTWTCPSCQSKCKKAHEKTVEDYFNLIKAQITNKDFRHFTKIKSPHVASRLLQNMNLRMHRAGPQTYYTRD